MKKRILSLALTATMLFGSINFAVAEDAPVVDSQDTAVTNTVESSGAIAVQDDTSETTPVDSLTHYPATAAGDWMAAVAGDAGGQEKITACVKQRSTGTQEFKEITTITDGKGNAVPAYEITATGDDSVYMRAGAADPATNKATSTGSVGKVASTSEGMAYYYQKINADYDFELSGTATIKSIDNTNNQVGFGAVVTDNIVPDVHYPEATKLVPPAADAQPEYANTIVAGRLRMAAAGKAPTSGGMMMGWYRINEELYGTDTARGSYLDTTLGLDAATPNVMPNDVYNIKIRKSGDIYTLTVNNDVRTINAADPHGSEGLPISFDGDIYVGFAVARCAEVEWTNLSLETITPVTSFKIASLPNKTSYYSTEPFDATGLTLEATYADGTVKTITDPAEYTLLGFDNENNKTFTTTGERTITIAMGNVRETFTVDVHSMKILKQEIKYAPAQTEFFVGTKFNARGLTARYYYEDGTHKDVNGFNNKISINGKVLTDGEILTADMAGENVEVVVEHADDDSIDTCGLTSTYNIDVINGTLTGIAVGTWPTKDTYFIGEDANYEGLTVQAVYSDGTKSYYRFISEDEYTVSGLDTSKAVEKLPITVTYNADPSLTATFTVSVNEPRAIRVELLTHPRYTYGQGEAFDPTGLNAQILYTSNTYEELNPEGVYYMFDGNKYFTQNGDATEAEAKAADYYIDLSKFDNQTLGTTTAYIKYNEAKGSFSDTELVCTITENTAHVWKAALLGASSMGVKGVGTSEIYATINGETQKSDKDKHNIEPQVMTDGTLPQVDSVRLNSWDGCGKVSGDQDGIAYYYTRVSNKNNFKVSADVTVNRYIREPDNLTADDQKNYDKYYKEAINDGNDEVTAKRIALDRLRSGQECFGIMAKDVVQMAGGIDENGQYTGGLNNHMTVNPDEAMTKPVTYTENGVKKTIEAPVDLYEAYTKHYVVKDSGDRSYEVSWKDVDNTFASNIVVAAACTDSTWPTDKNLSSYYKKTTMNRINLMVRSGVSAPDGGGERIGILNTTEKLPEAGEKYNITLEKINGGYMITTYDYQTGKTVSKRDFEDELEADNVLGIQNNDNIYVGFFASRWADCSVSNISLYETDPATDPTYTAGEEEAVSPKITVNSSLYVNYDNYSLSFKANNDHGGYCTISQNGKTIYSDIGVGKKLVNRDVTLVKDSVNKFTIVYYPSTADVLTSYDPVTYTFNVTHKSIDNTKLLYVGPDGSTAGDGTRENPIDLETAIGLLGTGGTIIALDGTYHVQDTDAAIINIPSTYSGIEGQPKTIMAEEGATPVLDLQNEYSGFAVDADYWIFDGLSITNAGPNLKAFQLAGMYDTIKNCTFYANGDSGFQISRINSKDKTIDMWPSYNLVQSCESYNNCDPSKNNADGFAAKLTIGYGNVFKDCISHHNLDDGWDCYTKLSTGAIGAVSIEDCISYRQGYRLYEDGTEADWDATSGGNGFKLGGENIYVKHYLKDCKTFENKSAGVDSNNNPAMKVRNVILYKNVDNNFALYSGTGNVLRDANKSIFDSQNRSYKFDYDIKGAVSVGPAADLIGSYSAESSSGSYVPDTTYGNVSTTPIVSESNYLKMIADTDDSTSLAVNSLGESIDPNTFFVSTNKNDSLVNGRYVRNDDKTFNHGTFLERTVPYVHEDADKVVLPNPYGDFETTTEGTTSDVTETTTTRRTSGGGGGGSTIKATTTTTSATEETTKATTTTPSTNKPIISKDVVVTIGSNVVKVGTDDFVVDATPYIQAASNSTLVPLRVVALAIMGGDVQNADNSEAIKWNNDTKTATILAGNKVVSFTAGSEVMTVDQKNMQMENGVKAELKEARMYVPFRALGKALGVEVEWNEVSKAAKFVAPTEATTEATTVAEDTTVVEAEESTEETSVDETAETTTVEETTVETTTVA